MRGGGVLLLATGALTIALAIGSGLASGAGPAKGSDRPPRALTDDDKAIWMTEWTACWHTKLHRLSVIFHIPITSGLTPQAAAKKLSKRAVRDLYETTPELTIGADGCRNGILWRYYH